MTPRDLDLDLNRVSVPLLWDELYCRSAPTDVEIGSGKGRFLNEMAAAHPERNFLAVERALKYHRLECERAAKRGLANVRVLRTTAEDLLFRLLPAESVATFFVLFPDPWPKKRHHKRRLIKPEVVEAMTRALQPGGLLLVKSDHSGYAEVIAEILAAAAGLEQIDPEQAFSGLPASGFEVKYHEQGRSIFPFACRRSD